VPTLPSVGGSTNTWGGELSAWLLHDHNADGTHKNTAAQGPINVKAAPYSAAGDGSADDTAALDSASAAAIATGAPLYLPPGSYRRTTAWDLRADGLVMFGAGALKTTIVQASANTPILLLGRQFQHVSDLKLTYATAQPSTATSANAVVWYKPYLGTYERIHVSKAARGFHTAQADYNLSAGDPDGNYTFSCTFADWWIEEYSIRALDFRSYNRRSTGCVFRNIYSVNEPAGVATTVARAWEFGVWDEIVMLQCNIEGVNCSTPALLLNDVLNATAYGLHFERVKLVTGWNNSYIDLFGTASKLTVDGLSVVFSNMPNVANGGNTRAGIAKVGDGTFLTIRGFSQHSNTLTADERALVVSDGLTTAIVEITNSSHAGMTTANILINGTQPQLPVLKRLNDSRYNWQENGKSVTTGTAAPTTGTWAVGDKVINTAPTAGGWTGWVCTTAGTPGTWKTYGAIAA